jgi:ABC-type molybdenum transport system ATPase subunit/photorepair protein PhrA
LPIKYFGRPRLPGPDNPGISVFDIQSRIGQSSPEIHAFFPKHLTIRSTLENAWADTFLTTPKLSYKDDRIVDAALRWFARELNPHHSGPDPVDSLRLAGAKSQNYTGPSSSSSRRLAEYMSSPIDWADNVRFRDVSFSAQRVALFLRAIIKKPDVVILDEAVSGLDVRTRTKCLLFLAYGETRCLGPLSASFKSYTKSWTLMNSHDLGANIAPFETRQSLVCVTHREDEVSPLVDRWLCLPDVNSQLPVRFGEIPYEARHHTTRSPAKNWWNDIWGEAISATRKWPERRKYFYD